MTFTGGEEDTDVETGIENSSNLRERLLSPAAAEHEQHHLFGKGDRSRNTRAFDELPVPEPDGKNLDENNNAERGLLKMSNGNGTAGGGTGGAVWAN